MCVYACVFICVWCVCVSVCGVCVCVCLYVLVVKLLQMTVVLLETVSARNSIKHGFLLEQKTQWKQRILVGSLQFCGNQALERNS